VDLSPLGLKLCPLILCTMLRLYAQSSPPTIPEEPASIEGVVLSDTTGQPLQRAQVALRPVEGGNGGLVQTTAETGTFSFSKVAPGRYTITVLRDGYLRQSAGRIGAYKMPPVFAIHSGDAIRSFAFRMTASSVVSGKVKFDDAEPAVNVVIQLYREFYSRGRHGYALAASTRTDDRGDYRAHGLEPGSYYVAALYQAPSVPPDATEQRRTDSSGSPAPELSYAVTFFPEVQKLADAVALRLTPGQEMAGIDIFLTLVHTVRIHGRVTSGLSGKVIPGPSITLRWNDPDNTGSVSAPINVSYDRDQNFEVRGVTTGPYLVITTGVDDGKTLSARTPISVGDADIANLDIVIVPEQTWKGKVRMEDDDDSTPLSGLQLALEPRRATAPIARATVETNGTFSLAFVPQETYDLFVLNAPEDAYLKSVRMGNFDRLATGLEAEPGGEPPAMEVVLSLHGGTVAGKAVTTDPAVVATGATVMLIPDPQIGRVQSYRTTFADENGNFLAKGLAPGNYVSLAWLDQPPCEVYNPDDLPACLAHGVRVQVSEGGVETIQVTAN
jgi:hypothetical protein